MMILGFTFDKIITNHVKGYLKMNYKEAIKLLKEVCICECSEYVTSKDEFWEAITVIIIAFEKLEKSKNKLNEYYRNKEIDGD